VRATRVDHYISILVVRVSVFDAYPLMPTMHSADRIRVHGKSKILMHAAFLPKDSLGVGVVALKRFHSFDLPEPPATAAYLFEINER
jgi:hypothetical protein